MCLVLSLEHSPCTYACMCKGVGSGSVGEGREGGCTYYLGPPAQGDCESLDLVHRRVEGVLVAGPRLPLLVLLLQGGRDGVQGLLGHQRVGV